MPVEQEGRRDSRSISVHWERVQRERQRWQNRADKHLFGIIRSADVWVKGHKGFFQPSYSPDVTTTPTLHFRAIDGALLQVRGTHISVITWDPHTGGPIRVPYWAGLDITSDTGRTEIHFENAGLKGLEDLRGVSAGIRHYPPGEGIGSGFYDSYAVGEDLELHPDPTKRVDVWDNAKQALLLLNGAYLEGVVDLTTQVVTPVSAGSSAIQR